MLLILLQVIKVLLITIIALILLGLLLNGEHSFKCFMYIHSFNTENSKRIYYDDCLHFTEEKVKSRAFYLPKVTG